MKKKWVILLIVFFLFLSLSLLFWYKNKGKEQNESYSLSNDLKNDHEIIIESKDKSKGKDKGKSKDKVTFMFYLSKNELYQTLLNNRAFYDSLTPYDLHARGVSSKQEYIQVIKDAVEEFDKEDEDKIRRLVGKAKTYFQSIKYDWFDGDVAAEIPWKFGAVTNVYEQGLPHTVGDVIILQKSYVKNASDSSLLNTIIHEKVHVYQKVTGIQDYLSQHGFEKLKKRDVSDCIRANPDIDEWVYLNTKNGMKYQAVYKSETPSSITDVEMYKNSQKYEHPLEEMAIVIANGYKG